MFLFPVLPDNELETAYSLPGATHWVEVAGHKGETDISLVTFENGSGSRAQRKSKSKKKKIKVWP